MTVASPGDVWPIRTLYPALLDTKRGEPIPSMIPLTIAVFFSCYLVFMSSYQGC
jgi:hypothetical protein